MSGADLARPELGEDWFPHHCRPAPQDMAPFNRVEIDRFHRLHIRNFDIQAWHSSALVAALDYGGRGLYFELLARQARDGHVAWDPEMLAAAGRMSSGAFRTAWALVRRAFLVLIPGTSGAPDGLANPVMHRELREMLVRSSEHADRGRRGAQARWGSRMSAGEPAKPQPSNSHSSAMQQPRPRQRAAMAAASTNNGGAMAIDGLETGTGIGIGGLGGIPTSGARDGKKSKGTLSSPAGDARVSEGSFAAEHVEADHEAERFAKDSVELTLGPTLSERQRQDLARWRTEFKRLWAAHPPRRGVKAKGSQAWEKYRALQPSPELAARIFAAHAKAVASQQWQDGYIPDLCTWLNPKARRWEDEHHKTAVQKWEEEWKAEDDAQLKESL